MSIEGRLQELDQRLSRQMNDRILENNETDSKFSLLANKAKEEAKALRERVASLEERFAELKTPKTFKDQHRYVYVYKESDHLYVFSCKDCDDIACSSTAHLHDVLNVGPCGKEQSAEFIKAEYARHKPNKSVAEHAEAEYERNKKALEKLCSEGKIQDWLQKQAKYESENHSAEKGIPAIEQQAFINGAPGSHKVTLEGEARIGPFLACTYRCERCHEYTYTKHHISSTEHVGECSKAPKRHSFFAKPSIDMDSNVYICQHCRVEVKGGEAARMATYATVCPGEEDRRNGAPGRHLFDYHAASSGCFIFKCRFCDYKHVTTRRDLSYVSVDKCRVAETFEDYARAKSLIHTPIMPPLLNPREQYEKEHTVTDFKLQLRSAEFTPNQAAELKRCIDTRTRAFVQSDYRKHQ